MKNTYVTNATQFLTAGLFLFFISACGNNVDDATIQENVNTHLKENAAFANISANVSEGVVTLTGTCEGENCAEKAAETINEVEGVQSIENNIQENNDTDLTLRTSVQAIISKYEGVQADVAAGVVVLRGSIDRNQVQPLMNELEALQPKKIDNQLAVQ